MSACRSSAGRLLRSFGPAAAKPESHAYNDNRSQKYHQLGGRGDWQPTVAVRACGLCLSEWLLSTESTATSRPKLIRGCHQDDGPGFHYQSPGLLQLTVLRHHWRVDVTSTVGAERRGQADHWHMTMWSHLTGASPAALASSASAVQERHSRLFIGVCPKLPGWRLPTCHRRRRQTTAFCRHSNTGRRSHKVLLAIENLLRQQLGFGTVCRLT